MPFVLTWDMETRYEIAGEGQPIVFLHGFTLDHRLWHPQAKVFSRGARVLRYDLRGHGESSGPGNRYAPDALAMQLRTLLDALKISRPVLVGHAFGAAIALDFALRHPTRVAALVLTSPEVWGAPVPDGSFFAGKGSPWFDAGPVDDPKACKRVLAGWLQSSVFEATRRNEQAFHTLESIVLSHGCVPWMRQPSFEPPDDFSSLARIEMPVLVLFGVGDDPYYKSAARALGERIGGARVVEIPGCGHVAPIERAVEFNRNVIEFLQGLGLVGALPPGAEVPPRPRRKRKHHVEKRMPEAEKPRPPRREETKKEPPKEQRPRRRRRRRRRPGEEVGPGAPRQAPRPAAEPPKKEKRGLFGWLFGKKKSSDS